MAAFLVFLHVREMKPASAWAAGRVENIAMSRMRDIARDIVAALPIVLVCILHLGVVTCTARVKSLR
jgi:hypothetical protein